MKFFLLTISINIYSSLVVPILINSHMTHPTAQVILILFPLPHIIHHQVLSTLPLKCSWIYPFCLALLSLWVSAVVNSPPNLSLLLPHTINFPHSSQSDLLKHTPRQAWNPPKVFQWLLSKIQTLHPGLQGFTQWGPVNSPISSHSSLVLHCRPLITLSTPTGIDTSCPLCPECSFFTFSYIFTYLVPYSGLSKNATSSENHFLGHLIHRSTEKNGSRYFCCSIFATAFLPVRQFCHKKK